MGATSIPSAVWPTSFGSDTYACQYQQSMRIPMPYSTISSGIPSTGGPGVSMTGNEVC